MPLTTLQDKSASYLVLGLLLSLVTNQGLYQLSFRELLKSHTHKHSTQPLGVLRALPSPDEGSNGSNPITSSSTSLYQNVPIKRPWTFGVLTLGFPPQQLLVPFVKFVTFQVWRLMMNELVTHDNQGRFIRESFQAGNNPSTLDLPGADYHKMGPN